MNRRQKGNALSQYGIIIGLVVLVAVPTFMAFGNQVVSGLTSYVDQYTNMNNKIDTNNKNNINSIANNNVNNPVDTTTPATPTTDQVDKNSNNVSCSATDNTCSIDFGDFKITGVPQNLNKIVETTGVSGGMDNLIGLLDQIAKQYEEQGKPEQALEIKKLATTGHNMALIQKSFEDFAFNTCKNDTACISSYANKTYPKPAGYNETYSSFPTSVKYVDAPWLTSIGVALNSRQGSSSESTVSRFYQDTLDKIRQDSSISDEAKGVIQELTWDIGTLSQKWVPMFAYLTCPMPESSKNSNFTYLYDPLSGSITKNYYNSSISNDSMYQDIQNINAPELTHVDSGLICASGGYSDSGTSCH